VVTGFTPLFWQFPEDLMHQVDFPLHVHLPPSEIVPDSISPPDRESDVTVMEIQHTRKVCHAI
jgi:hypothetical protein